LFVLKAGLVRAVIAIVIVIVDLFHAAAAALLRHHASVRPNMMHRDLDAARLARCRGHPAASTCQGLPFLLPAGGAGLMNPQTIDVDSTRCEPCTGWLKDFKKTLKTSMVMTTTIQNKDWSLVIGHCPNQASKQVLECGIGTIQQAHAS
jgi:hypothetical protein